jgi:hypothetical protein
MTSVDSLSLILRRLDEIERKLDRIWKSYGPQLPSAIRHAVAVAVQDFTKIARQLARLNQHFRQASFAEFEMLMALDDEVLKRYGLPEPTVKRALIEAYETVVLDQQR